MTAAAPAGIDTEPGPTDLMLLAGVGGIPDATVEWVIGAKLTLVSEAHIGGQGDPSDPDGPIDLILDRDPATGAPRLRLTTLTGLLRHRLLDTLDGYGRAADTAAATGSAAELDSLFGSTTGISSLTGSDIHLHLPTGVGVLLRPHNHVDPGTGAAKLGAYWFTEHLPAGTHGLVHLRLRCTTESEAVLLSLLGRAADGLSPDAGDSIRVGARTRIGQGELATSGWVAHRHDLTTPDGWAAVHHPTWAEHADRLRSVISASGQGSLTAAIAAAAPDLLDPLHRWHRDHPDGRRFDTITLTVRIGQQNDPGRPNPDTVRPGLLRVGDLPRLGQHTDADLVHRTTPRITGNGAVDWVPVLGVPSLLAVLKTAAIRAAGVTVGPEAAIQWCRQWWGSDPGDPGPPVPGRITITEAALHKAQPLTRGRSSVDTLFGDAADQHLFTEIVYAGGEATLTITVRDPDDAVRGQLLLLVCDLASWSPTPIGGGGHGAFTATNATWTSHGAGPGSDATAIDWLALLTDPAHPARPDAAHWMRAYRGALIGQEQQ